MFDKSHRLLISFISAVMLILLIGGTNTFALDIVNNISGNIVDDTTWNDTTCVYKLNRDIAIKQGVSLTISSGVTVDGGNHKITVYGELKTNGATLLNTSISIGNIESSENPASIILKETSFSNGAFLSPSGNAAYAHVELRNNRIFDTLDYTYIWYPVDATYITGNIFKNFGGFSIGSDYDVYINNNEFHGHNTGNRALISDWAQYNNSYCYVRYNKFDYTGSVLELPSGYSPANIIADHNYWYTFIKEKIEARIFDYNDDFGCAAEIPYLPIVDENGREAETTSILDHEHKWGDWSVEEEATCEKPGISVRTCSGCGDKEEKDIPATGHKWGSWSVEKEATCATEGIKERVCENCAQKETEVIPATGEHKWGDWSVEEEATCEKPGISVRTCSGCGDKEEKNIPATGHKWGSWSVEKEATCATEGIKERVCENCAQKETEVIPATGEHKWSKWSVEKEPACEKLGLSVRICSGCGNKEEKDIPATGHKWGDWTVLTPATEETEGIEVRICENDPSHVESRTIDKKEPGVDVKVTSIKIAADPSVTICAGKKVKLSATVSPKNALQTVTWKSSNKNYATVNSNGVVTTKKAGIGKTVTITAKAKDGSGKTAKIRIKIVKDGVTKITLKGKTSRPAGKQLTIKATVTAGKTANTELKWVSSNNEYATVNKKGVVTLKEAGKGKYVRITAMATDGTGRKATIKIKIT